MVSYDVGALPARVNVRHLAGLPFRMELPVTMNGGPLEAAAIVAVRAHVRQTVGSEIISHVFSTENDPADIEVTGTSAAVLVITATSEVTSAWQQLWPGRAPETVMWWDIEMIDLDGVPLQLTVPGTFTLVHQVTR